MTAKERIRMIALEVQELSEAVEHYKSGWGCYGAENRHAPLARTLGCYVHRLQERISRRAESGT